MPRRLKLKRYIFTVQRMYNFFSYFKDEHIVVVELAKYHHINVVNCGSAESLT